VWARTPHSARRLYLRRTSDTRHRVSPRSATHTRVPCTLHLQRHGTPRARGSRVRAVSRSRARRRAPRGPEQNQKAGPGGRGRTLGSPAAPRAGASVRSCAARLVTYLCARDTRAVCEEIKRWRSAVHGLPVWDRVCGRDRIGSGSVHIIGHRGSYEVGQEALWVAQHAHGGRRARDARPRSRLLRRLQRRRAQQRGLCGEIENPPVGATGRRRPHVRRDRRDALVRGARRL
jgi:hypothetical protein